MPGTGSPWHDRSGSIALEFGLVSGIFLLLMLGAMDLGRYYMTEHSLHTVMARAARAAVIDTTLTGCSAPATRVASAAPFLNVGQLTLCVAQSTTAGVTKITVTASYPFTFMLPTWATNSRVLSDSTTVSY